MSKALGVALVAATPAARAGAGGEASGGAGGEAAAAGRRNVSVLLVDRSSDLFTPLLHDFGLEALAEARGVLREGRFRCREEPRGAGRSGE